MTKHIDDAASEERGITRETLYRTLLGDIEAAFDWLEVEGSQTSKRNLIRTMFAGIEGSLWSFKEHLRSIASEIEKLTPLQDFAMSGRDYMITDSFLFKRLFENIIQEVQGKLMFCVLDNPPQNRV